MNKFQIGNYVKFKDISDVTDKETFNSGWVKNPQIVNLNGANAVIRYEVGPYPAATVNLNLNQIEGIDWNSEYLNLLGFTFKDKAYFYETPDYHYRLMKNKEGIEVLLRVKEASEISKETYWKTFLNLQVHEVQNIFFNYTGGLTLHDYML